MLGKIPEAKVCWLQWPDDISKPTQEEWDRAEELYIKSCQPNDYSDYVCGLDFVMATYSRWIWWKFFFPDEISKIWNFKI